MDPKLREYARMENDHILYLLLRQERGSTTEEPEELAERNCGATERSFGKNDPLHAMALNTYAFVLLYTGRNPEGALASATEAHAISRALEDGEQLRLESQCLAALARHRLGESIASATCALFDVPVSDADARAGKTAAVRAVSDTLMASVLERPLKGVVAIMALRDLAAELSKELEPSGDEEANRALGQALALFLETYYRRSADSGNDDGDG